MHLLRSSLAATILLCISSHANATSWSITDFGSTSGMYAGDLNFNGQMVGINGKVAAIKQGSTVTTLGTLGGSWSQAFGINSTGQVVGAAYITGDVEHAFFWSNGKIQDLGTLGGSWSYATAINSAGQVVGGSSTSSGEMHAIGTPWSYATAINSAGQVVGSSHPASGQSAFLWSNGEMQYLGTLGGNYSYANGINSAGQVVGYSGVTGNATHAFLWSDGVMQDLGTLGGNYSYARDINSAGQVVGDSTTADNIPRGFLWSNGVMQDLNTLIDDPTWFLQDVKHVDDLGRVVGFGYHNDIYSGFLLTPKDAAPAVPEPGAVVLLGAGLLGIAGYRRFCR